MPCCCMYISERTVEKLTMSIVNAFIEAKLVCQSPMQLRKPLCHWKRRSKGFGIDGNEKTTASLRKNFTKHFSGDAFAGAHQALA